MNTNEEKNIADVESASGEEVVSHPQKKLSRGALIGIIAGAAAVLVAVVVLIILLGGGKNKCEHIDADDDYLCDKCGEHFDDGDEEVIPDVKEAEVNFVVRLDNGDTISGIKFILTRGDAVYTLVSGADGSIKAKIPVGVYEVTYDSETIPEYCWGETYGVKIEEGTTSAEIKIVDNRPNGTVGKPYPVSADAMDITIAPGEELYYSCRGVSLRYLTIENSDLVVNYDGESYSAIDGIISVGVVSSDVETPIIFSVKNPTSDSISASMEIIAPLGSSDNPIEMTESHATCQLADGESIYYRYLVEKEGVLVLTTPTEGSDILITRNIIVINENGEEEVRNTITEGASAEYAGYIFVKENDEILIRVSYVAPEEEGAPEAQVESEPVEVEFAIAHYAATDDEPAPIDNSQLNIRLDAGASVTFSVKAGMTLSVSVNGEYTLDVSLGGDTVSLGEEITAVEDTTLTITNPNEMMGNLTISTK